MNNKTTSQSSMIDLSWVLGTLLSLKWALLQVPGLWTFAGPISLLSALIVATWRLHANNQSWQSLGIFKVPSKKYIIIWSLIALGITVMAGNLVGMIINAIMTSSTETAAQAATTDTDRFANVVGNWPVYLFWLMVSWVIGGFTEEMLFRGFFILSLENALKNTVLTKTTFATASAIVIQGVIFGQQHYYYQGMSGFFVTGIIAIISGIIFIKCKRTLWPLIISHGLANTIGMTLRFTGNG